MNEKIPFYHTEQPIKSFEELVLVKLRARAVTGLSADVFKDVTVQKMHDYADIVADDLYVAATNLFVSAKEKVVKGPPVRYPTTWWQHLRARLGLKHRTIEVDTATTIYHVCPHLPIPHCEKHSHFRWLMAVDEEGEA